MDKVHINDSWSEYLLEAMKNSLYDESYEYTHLFVENQLFVNTGFPSTILTFWFFLMIEASYSFLFCLPSKRKQPVFQWILYGFQLKLKSAIQREKVRKKKSGLCNMDEWKSILTKSIHVRSKFKLKMSITHWIWQRYFYWL